MALALASGLSEGSKNMLAWRLAGALVRNLGAIMKLSARGDASRTAWNPDVETLTESAGSINEGEIVHCRPSIGPPRSAVK